MSAAATSMAAGLSSAMYSTPRVLADMPRLRMVDGYSVADNDDLQQFAHTAEECLGTVSSLWPLRAAAAASSSFTAAGDILAGDILALAATQVIITTTFLANLTLVMLCHLYKYALTK